jgi:hypothetical protein
MDKNPTDETVGQDIENRLMDTVGSRRKERARCMQRVTWKHTYCHM